MKDTIDRFVKWLEEYDAALSFKLNPPADIEAIEKIQSIIGEEMPELLRELYLRFDGQAWESTNGVFYGFALQPLENVLGLIMDYESAPSKEELVIDGQWVDDVVKPYYTHPKWISFAKDAGANFLSLDFDPGVNGRKGQLIGNGFDIEQVVFITSYFSDYFIWYVDQLESGKYYIGAPDGIYDEPAGDTFEIEQGTHFLELPKSYFSNIPTS